MGRVWLALVFILPLAFGPFLNDTFALPKVMVLRWGALCLAALWLQDWLSRPRLELPARPSAVEWGALSLLAVSGISALDSDFRAVSVLGMSGFYAEGWTSLLCYGLLFLLAARRLSDETLQATDNAMAYGAVFVAVYALAQASGFDIFVWKHGQAIWERPWSTLGNPNYLGAFLAMILPVLWHRVLTRSGLWSWLPAVLSVSVLPWTRSEAAMAAGFFGLVLWLWWERDLARRRWRRLAGAAGAALILIFCLWAWRARHPHPGAAADASAAPVLTAPAVRSSWQGRVMMWRAAWRIFRRYPVMGAGPDTFAYHCPRWLSAEFGRTVGEGMSAAYAHNAVCNTAATMGGLGLAAYALLAGAGLALAWRRRARVGSPQGFPVGAAAAGLAAVWLNNELSFHTVATAGYAWIFLGVLCRDAAPGGPARTVGAPPGLARAARWAVFLTVILLAGAAGAGLAASRYDRVAEDAMAVPNGWRRAVRCAGIAVRLDPWHPGYRVRLGRALQEGILGGVSDEERRFYFERSIGVYGEQLSRTPTETLARNGLGVSFIQAALSWGQPEYFRKAEAAFRQALDFNPNFDEAYSNLAGCLYLQGRKDESIRLYREAVANKPGTALFRLNFGDVLAQEGRWPEAVRQWQAVLNIEPGNPDALERFRRTENGAQP
ncbi:MAG TPA: hypothetical protein DEB40_00945 [Elusimicrobia bacterium]|nr:hypothetical protein [Elusimicrobiota bacterium]HBT60296.1 hypothetical protein [Elusimicrobiota bacterium]